MNQAELLTEIVAHLEIKRDELLAASKDDAATHTESITALVQAITTAEILTFVLKIAAENQIYLTLKTSQHENH